MTDSYDDIINLPHHVSKNRPHVSEYDRASQFAPFKALVGLEGEISETARITQTKLEISEDDVEKTNNALQKVKTDILSRPRVKIIYFSPDSKKEGGEYLSYEGNVKHIDEGEHRIFFTDGKSVLLTDLYELVVV